MVIENIKVAHSNSEGVLNVVYLVLFVIIVNFLEYKRECHF